MSLIKNESIKGTIISYLGAFLGMLIVVFIMPKYLSSEQIGLMRLINDSALFFASIAMFGGSYSLMYFYPKFSNDTKRVNSLFSIVLFYALLGYIILLGCFYFFKDSIFAFYNENSQVLFKYTIIFFPLIFLSIIQFLFEAFSNNLLKISFPKFLKEISNRILIIISILLYYHDVITFNTLMVFQLLIVLVNTIALVYYVIKYSNNVFDYKLLLFPNYEDSKQILIYGFFLVLGVMGSILANKLDSFILSSTANGLSKNGVYTTSLFIITMIEMPARSLLSITTPIISEALNVNDLNKVKVLYKKTSNTLYFIATYIFLCIWCNADNIFGIMPNGNEFIAGKYVLLLLGISKLFDSVTSINLVIVNNSKYYKYSLFFQLILGVFTIFTAYLFIPKYGILGAAISTAISIFVYQLIITIFIFIKYKILPFSIISLKITFILIVSYIIIYFIPSNSNNIIGIIVNVTILSIIYILMIFKVNISEEIRNLMSNILQRFRLFFKR